MTLTRDLIARVGLAAFGKDWLSPMASYLAISRRRLERWYAGNFDLSPEAADEFYKELKRLCGPQAQRLAAEGNKMYRRSAVLGLLAIELNDGEPLVQDRDAYRADPHAEDGRDRQSPDGKHC